VGLVPQQTQPMTATVKDASGNTLLGRTVTWSSNAGAVASVNSTTGLVTANAAGGATITATSEGKSGTATITVGEGGLVGATGGVVNTANGAVRVTVPAGALATATAITVTPDPNPPALPADSSVRVSGGSYILGPAGTNFTTPVTVTFKWDPATAPPWAQPGNFRIRHYTGGQWVTLPVSAVDPVARTVSAQVSSFSPFSLTAQLGNVTLTPNPASVTFLVRSANITAAVPGNPNAMGLTFHYDHTNLNGSITHTGPNDPSVQYTFTGTAPPAGDLDYVRVIVRGVAVPGGTPVALASRVVKVDANPQYTFSLEPQFNDVSFGQTKNLDAVVRNPDGSIFTGIPAGPRNAAAPVRQIWTRTSFHGDIDITSPAPTNTKRAVYTAKDTGQSASLPPRIDKVTVEFEIPYFETNQGFDQSGSLQTFTQVKYKPAQGKSDAFVEVAKKVYLSSFVVRSIPSPGGECTTADAIVPKVPGATSYALKVTGVVNGLGPTYNRTVTGTTSTGSIMDIYDVTGQDFRVPLEGGCNTTPQGIQGRRTLYQNAFGPAKFVSTVSP
jgi:hypothetical protein